MNSTLTPLVASAIRRLRYGNVLSNRVTLPMETSINSELILDESMNKSIRYASFSSTQLTVAAAPEISNATIVKISPSSLTICVGLAVGTFVGSDDGLNVGYAVGSALGLIVGSAVGSDVGSLVGSDVGCRVGSMVGSAVGSMVGSVVRSLHSSNTLIDCVLSAESHSIVGSSNGGISSKEA